MEENTVYIKTDKSRVSFGIDVFTFETQNREIASDVFLETIR